MEYALQAVGLCKKYDKFTLDNVDISVPYGSILGFIGENGAGKSTTIKALMALIRRDSGKITILSKENGMQFADIRQKVGVVFDECALPSNLTPDNINLMMKYIYKEWDSSLFLRYLKDFDLPKNKIIQSFSRGMKMKLAISAALSHNPRLLILDEATGGLDPISRNQILDIFSGYAKQNDCAVLISSHILTDLEKICSSISFIHKGKIILSGEKEQLLKSFYRIRCCEEQLKKIPSEKIYGFKRDSFGIDGLVERTAVLDGIEYASPSLEDIMVFLTAKEEGKCLDC